MDTSHNSKNYNGRKKAIIYQMEKTGSLKIEFITDSNFFAISELELPIEMWFLLLDRYFQAQTFDYEHFGLISEA